MNFSRTWFHVLALSSILLTGGLIASPTHAQKVVNINPALDKSNVSPETSISGVFDSSEGASVDSKSVKIYLNDRNITDESTITDRFFSYKPASPLQLGNYVVKIEYQNSQGQQKVASWNFRVQNTQNDLEISSVTHNATSTLGNEATFLATIEGTPQATASILLMEEGQPSIEIPAKEVSQGVYVGTYNVKTQRSDSEGIVIGRLQKNDQTVYDAATQGFAFNNQTDSSEVPEVATGKDLSLRPNFTNYQDGDQISTTGFTLEGQTLPNAKVEVEVSSKVPVLGGIINVDLGGNTFFEQTVTANEQGNFQVAIPAPNGLTSGMKYTVRAVASKQEETSQPVQLTLVQQ